MKKWTDQWAFQMNFVQSEPWNTVLFSKAFDTWLSGTEFPMSSTSVLVQFMKQNTLSHARPCLSSPDAKVRALTDPFSGRRSKANLPPRKATVSTSSSEVRFRCQLLPDCCVLSGTYPLEEVDAHVSKHVRLKINSLTVRNEAFQGPAPRKKILWSESVTSAGPFSWHWWPRRN